MLDDNVDIVRLQRPALVRLSALDINAPVAPSPTPAAASGTEEAQQAFQRGLTALTQWVEREGAGRSVPRGHGEPIAVDGETEPVIVKLGIWASNTKSRRDKLSAEQPSALRELGVDWA
ncbi:Helicase associated domain protein [Streptomyces sp. NPDC058595]|uniref:Helicase associated domain protein n=1 Tax=Streptomyces sp. NPDC058595 TaxID=3346550 RepID=UPI003657CCEC